VVELDGAYLDVDEHGVVEELAENALVGIPETVVWRRSSAGISARPPRRTPRGTCPEVGRGPVGTVER
jgi:hypothetical protein